MHFLKDLLQALMFFLTISVYAQTTFDQGNISIEYIESETVSNTLNLNSSTKIKGNCIQKISVKCKIKSLNGDKIDINKISLLDTVNKIRYRPTDVSFQPVAGYISYGKLLKSDIKKKGLIGHYRLGAAYRPEIKDTFEDYLFEGYKNYQVIFNFWTNKDPLLSYIYFQPHKFKSFKALLFFPILEEAENGQLALYYGYEKVAEFTFN